MQKFHSSFARSVTTLLCASFAAVAPACVYAQANVANFGTSTAVRFPVDRQRREYGASF